MAKKKKERIYEPNPALNGFLTAFFAFDVVYAVYTLLDDSDDATYLWLWLAAVGVTAVCIRLSNRVWDVLGHWFSSVALNYLGDPLGKRVTRHKFVDQMWQLGVHTTMTFAGLWILKDEPWLEEPSTMWVRLGSQGVCVCVRVSQMRLGSLDSRCSYTAAALPRPVSYTHLTLPTICSV